MIVFLKYTFWSTKTDSIFYFILFFLFCTTYLLFYFQLQKKTLLKCSGEFQLSALSESIFEWWSLRCSKQCAHAEDNAASNRSRMRLLSNTEGWTCFVWEWRNIRSVCKVLWNEGDAGFQWSTYTSGTVCKYCSSMRRLCMKCFMCNIRQYAAWRIEVKPHWDSIGTLRLEGV